jgi:hypothetical protein
MSNIDTSMIYETCYDGQYDGHCVEHHCDDVFEVSKLSKDRPFDTMRRDLYFNSQHWCTNAEKIRMYTDEKNRLKDKNGQLHTLFFNNNKGLILSYLIESLEIATFVNVPKNLMIPVTNGRLVYYNGNAKCALFESTNSYYVVRWAGS